MRTVAVVWLALVAPALAQEKPAEPPAIVTSGEGFVRRGPDIAFVTLGIETRAKNPRDAQQQNATAAAAVIRRLTDLGIARDALRTLGLRLDQEFDNVGGRRVARDFVAHNTLDVRVDEIARAGEIADAAVQSGATSVDGIRFDLKDRSGAEREALRLAVADARARADAAAAGAGRAVDRILKIEDTRAVGIIPRPVMPMGGRIAAAEVTPVEPGELEIRASVVLTVAMR